jgi:hypothetical protein
VSDPDFAALAKEAQRAVEGLKEPALSIAYARILDELIARAKAKQAAVRPAPRDAQGAAPAATEAAAADLFMTRPFDASPYADLFLSPGKLVLKSLAVLKLARDEFGIDGLGPGAISSILTKKFRVSGVHRGNISRDLGKSLKYVSRISRGGATVYIITAPGEEALKQAISAPAPE